MLTREELINNLWLTDEISSELKILENEIKKKERLLKETVEESKQEFLKSIETNYYQSSEYQKDENFQKLIEKFKDMDETVNLVSTIVVTVVCLFLIHIDIPLLQVAILWLVVPRMVYFPYFVTKKIYLKQSQPDGEIKAIEDVLNETRESLNCQQLPDSLLSSYIKQELDILNQKRVEIQQVLASKTVLPPNYQMRGKEVVWYLENKVADNLKEAVSALEEADHRKKVEEILEVQNNEIKILKETLVLVMEENEKLRKHQEQLDQNKKR